MRNVFRRMGARTGISLGLIVIVAAVVLVAKLVDDRRARPPYRAGTDPQPMATDTLGDDGPRDEVEPTSYPDDAVVLSLAAEFATAWLRRDLPAEQWLNGLRPLATEDLLERLEGVDPLDVPPNTTLGEPTFRIRSEGYAEVLVPIAPHDALALGLGQVEGEWLVTTLDRETG